MKTLLVGLMILSSSAYASYSQVDLLCKQKEGAKRYEVGIALAEFGEINAKIVEVKNFRRRLIADENVKMRTVNRQNVFTNSFLNLRVLNPNALAPVAILNISDDGLRLAKNVVLECAKDKILRY